jgi:hypothetical protein
VLVICVVLVFAVMLVPYNQWAGLFNSDTSMVFCCTGVLFELILHLTNLTHAHSVLNYYLGCLILFLSEILVLPVGWFYSNDLLPKGYYLCWLVLCMASAFVCCMLGCFVGNWCLTCAVH